MKPETLRYLSNLRNRLNREHFTWLSQMFGVEVLARTLRYQHLDRVQYFRDSLALRPEVQP